MSNLLILRILGPQDPSMQGDRGALGSVLLIIVFWGEGFEVKSMAEVEFEVGNHGKVKANL